MKKLARLLALSFAVPVALSFATPVAAGPQQEKMKSCNAEATQQGLTGDARKDFMKKCLSASKAAKKELTPQQAKMKQCNGDASKKNLKGKERKKFMSECLKS